MIGNIRNATSSAVIGKVFVGNLLFVGAWYAHLLSLPASPSNFHVAMSIRPIFVDISTFGLPDKVAIRYSSFFIKRYQFHPIKKVDETMRLWVYTNFDSNITRMAIAWNHKIRSDVIKNPSSSAYEKFPVIYLIWRGRHERRRWMLNLVNFCSCFWSGHLMSHLFNSPTSAMCKFGGNCHKQFGTNYLYVRSDFIVCLCAYARLCVFMYVYVSISISLSASLCVCLNV